MKKECCTRSTTSTICLWRLQSQKKMFFPAQRTSPRTHYLITCHRRVLSLAGTFASWWGGDENGIKYAGQVCLECMLPHTAEAFLKLQKRKHAFHCLLRSVRMVPSSRLCAQHRGLLSKKGTLQKDALRKRLRQLV